MNDNIFTIWSDQIAVIWVFSMKGLIYLVLILHGKVTTWLLYIHMRFLNHLEFGMCKVVLFKLPHHPPFWSSMSTLLVYRFSWLACFRVVHSPLTWCLTIGYCNIRSSSLFHVCACKQCSFAQYSIRGKLLGSLCCDSWSWFWNVLHGTHFTSPCSLYKCTKNLQSSF